MMSQLPPERFGCYTWQIEDFFTLSRAGDFLLHTPPFTAAGATWCLRFRLEERCSEKNYTLNLVRLESSFPKGTLDCFVGLKNSIDELFHYSYDEITFEEVGESEDLCRYLDLDELMSEDPAMNGRLTVYLLLFNLEERREIVLSSERNFFVPVEEFCMMSQLPPERLDCYAWQIDDFFSLSKAKKFSLDSPSFEAADSTCCLRLYSNDGNNLIRLSLIRLESAFPEHSLFYFVGLKNFSGELFCSFYDEETFAEDGRIVELSYGKFIDSMTINEKLMSKDGVQNGRLTIYFVMFNLSDIKRKEIVLSSERENFVPVEGVEKLAHDLKSLLLSETDSDVTIRIEGREFPAHKAIIGVRSPVFAAMLRSEMKEKATGVVDIKDLDPDVFPDFLAFLYTGHKDQLTVKNVFGLYKAADMYDVGELKSSCVQFMTRSLSVETYCDVISISLLHGVKELLQEGITYFSRHMLEILETVKWQRFLNENPTQGNELLIKALRKKNGL